MHRSCEHSALCWRRNANSRMARSTSFYCNIPSKSNERMGRWKRSLRHWRRMEIGMAGRQPWSVRLVSVTLYCCSHYDQAKLVGVPCGMAVQFILEGVLTKPGVHAPYDEEVTFLFSTPARTADYALCRPASYSEIGWRMRRGSRWWSRSCDRVRISCED